MFNYQVVVSMTMEVIPELKEEERWANLIWKNSQFSWCCSLIVFLTVGLDNHLTHHSGAQKNIFSDPIERAPDIYGQSDMLAAWITWIVFTVSVAGCSSLSWKTTALKWKQLLWESTGIARRSSLPDWSADQKQLRLQNHLLMIIMIDDDSRCDHYLLIGTQLAIKQWWRISRKSETDNRNEVYWKS